MLYIYSVQLFYNTYISCTICISWEVGNCNHPRLTVLRRSAIIVESNVLMTCLCCHLSMLWIFCWFIGFAIGLSLIYFQLSLYSFLAVAEVEPLVKNIINTNRKKIFSIRRFKINILGSWQCSHCHFSYRCLLWTHKIYLFLQCRLW